MESIRKIIQPKTAGPVDLSLILNSTVNIKIKLQLVQKISDAIEECCRTQNYFDNMIFVLLKLLSMTEPAFSPDNDIFKLRKLILQIIHKVSSSNDKIKNHIQNTMGACLKVMETDNEQCVVYCVLIFKELLTAFKPKFDGSLNTEIVKFLKLVIDMYNNSNTQDQILTFQKTSDLKVLISTIRLTTTITKNSVNYIFIPMGKVSMKVLKEVAHILKLFYMLFYSSQSFKKEIIEFLPILMKFFNLDIPYKPDYRDLILDLKHAQIRLLFFFSIFLRDNKDEIRFYCTSLPGRVISLLNCNLSSDVSSLRTELLSGFESVILIDYKSEFLPFMDKFLDETLITGKSWSLKSVLRPKAYIYIDHLITHLHNQLSLNFLVRVIHLHFSNILDTTLQPEVQINLCNMVMNVLSYIVQRQNQLITNINTIESKKNSIIDLFYRVFKIFVIKLKQFQKFYLPQLDEKSFSQENVIETISSILEENRLKKDQEFIYGYHSSQIVPYTIADCKRFIKIIIPAIRTLFQFIVKFEGCKFSVEHYYKKSFEHFITHSFLSLKVCNCPIQKKEMVKEILGALSCINPIHLKTLVTGDFIIKLIYDNNLESLVFDMALNDEVLVTSFSCLMFEFVLNNLTNKNERQCIFDLADRLQLNLKLHTNEETINEYIYKIIKRLLNNLQFTQNPLFYLGILKIILMIMESAKYEFGENINSLLRCLFCELFSYYQGLPINSGLIKPALAELCIAECVFNVVLHSQIMNAMSVIAYALQIPEMTPQGLCILGKYWDILPDIFFNDSIHQVRNEIIKRLYHCLDSPLHSISQPAMCLLGKFGGLNRSSINEPYQLIPQEKYNYFSNKPNIQLSFVEYSDQSLEINIEPGISTAIETLITNNDKFNRAHSWNVIKGFLMVSMECNIIETTELLSRIE